MHFVEGDSNCFHRYDVSREKRRRRRRREQDIKNRLIKKTSALLCDTK
jgi:hypothetical protein